MDQLIRRFEWPIMITMFLAGSAFLLKMCYLSLAFNTVFAIVFLLTLYGFVRARFSVSMPPQLLALVLAGVEVDALGNYLRMYGSQFGPLHYDEFAHLSIQVLITPLIVWLTGAALKKFEQKLSLGFTTFFAGVTIFALSAFYEIIELWDELYFNGHRIWSTHDTANDLQFDLCGIVLGGLLAFALLKHSIARGDLSGQQLPKAV